MLRKNNKLKVISLVLMGLLLVVGASYAFWEFSYVGSSNVIKTSDVSFRLLESNNEVINIENAIPMKDEEGMNQTDTGNVFDFEVKSKVKQVTDVKYIVNIEELSVDSGKTQVPDNKIKVYVEDFAGNTVLKPTKISELNNYKLFEKTHRHSTSKEELSTKYKLKVWLDESTDIFNNKDKQFKFKIGVTTEQDKQDENKTYTLKYNTNNGVGTISNQTVKIGNSVTITDVVPTRSGYEFLGWSTNKSDKEATYTSGQTVTLNNVYDDEIVLYAVWKEEVYTVLYTDGTLIINEQGKNRSSNITKHGTVTKEYAAYSNSNSYVMTAATQQPWYNEASSIINVEIGQNISPTSTAFWFFGLINMKKGDFTNLNTSNVVNMDVMFALAGSNSSTFELTGINDWDTSKVTSMISLFYSTGSMAPIFSLDLSGWDTGSVTSMVSMFNSAGKSATSWSIGNLSNWDTSSVTDMENMFGSAGKDALNFALDLSGWDTSSVTDMASMFDSAGKSATSWSVGNLSNWDTSSVTDMGNMFNSAGYSSENFELVWFGNWDTSKVTGMNNMFNNAGYSAAVWDIGDISNWDVSEVVTISNMFAYAGYEATTFSLDLSGWDTSKIQRMNAVFSFAGYNATTFELIGLQNWNISTTYDTESMFNSAGYSATAFSLDLSNWSMSSVSSMENMFSSAGSSATTWSVTIPSTTGTLTNTTSKWYGSSSDAYAEPDNGKSFTLKYNVNVVVQNGTLASNEQASKKVLSGNNTTFNLTPNSVDMTGTVTCTNNQTGTITNNILTVSNVTNDTTCTVSFNEVIIASSTVLYTDGTLIINEKATDRSSNITKHGEVTNEYEPYSDSNSYVLDSYSEQPWYSKANYITGIILGQEISPVSTSYWFYGLSSLVGGDFANLNTSSVENMSYMFAGICSSAMSFDLDLSSWNTSSVTDMSYMFWNTFNNVSNIDFSSISNWNTSSVESMSFMFAEAGLSSDTFSLDLSGWDTSSVTDVSNMFDTAGFGSTTFVLNLSTWDTSNATDMTSMFKDAGSYSPTWTVTIPSTTGTLTNTTSKLYGSSSSVYAGPPSGKSFTLAS